MNTHGLFTIGSTLAAATFLGLWITERGNHPKEPDTDRFYVRIAAGVAEREQRQMSRMANLNEELHKTKALLNETSLQLTDANVAIVDLRKALPQVDQLEMAKGLKLAGPGLDGRFERLIARDGTVLSEDVEFSSESDGRLTFKTPKGRRAFNANDLHPAIVGSLGFNLNALHAKAREGAIKRAAIRAEVEKAIAVAAIDNRRLAQEKAHQDHILQQERIKANKELQQQQMQYDLAQQQLRVQQERDRANELLRQQQLQLERARLNNEAYQLHLLQQQQMRTRIITVPQSQSVSSPQPQSYSAL